MYYLVYINFSLMLFNLLPVPPLDGFNACRAIFDIDGTKLMKYGSAILIILIIFNIPSLILSRPLAFLVNTIVFR
jgi:Zn-dependent protease